MCEPDEEEDNASFEDEDDRNADNLDADREEQFREWNRPGGRSDYQYDPLRE